MTYDASSRKDIRAAEKSATRLANDRLQFLRAALDTREGRAWFYHFLADCHLFADPFTNDALREAYTKGERNVGLRIFADIIANCPDQYILMVKDENVRLAAHTAATERSRSPNHGWDDQGRGPAGDIDPSLDPFAELDS